MRHILLSYFAVKFQKSFSKEDPIGAKVLVFTDCISKIELGDQTNISLDLTRCNFTDLSTFSLFSQTNLHSYDKVSIYRNNIVLCVSISYHKIVHQTIIRILETNATSVSYFYQNCGWFGWIRIPPNV